jgi:hypothetical protein
MIEVSAAGKLMDVELFAAASYCLPNLDLKSSKF